MTNQDLEQAANDVIDCDHEVTIGGDDNLVNGYYLCDVCRERLIDALGKQRRGGMRTVSGRGPV